MCVLRKNYYMTVFLAQQAKHAVQVRMQHVPSPAAPTMTPTSMRAPTPSSAQHSTHTSQASVPRSPAPFVPSPAMHPSPSPQVRYFVDSPSTPHRRDWKFQGEEGVSKD